MPKATQYDCQYQTVSTQCFCGRWFNRSLIESLGSRDYDNAIPSRYLAHGCYAMTTYNPSSGTWSKTHSSISVEFKHNQGRHPPQALQSTWPSETLFVGACAKTLLSFSIYLPYCFSTELRCTALVLQGPALLIEWLKLICVTETVKGQVVLESTLFQKTWAKGKMMSVSWDQLSA